MNGTRVGIRELKNNLSKYMRQVKRGETVLITEHGTPIARIISEGISLEARMSGLITAGVISWNEKKLPPRKPVTINRGPRLVSSLVSEERNVNYLS